MRNLLNVLAAEMQRRQSGGIYHRLQIDFAYNSNHIEGSTLNKDQTRFIFDTQTLGIEARDQTPVRVNDVIETVNHFRCFDHIIRTANEPVSEEYVKNLHAMLADFPNATFEEISIPEKQDMLKPGLSKEYDVLVFHDQSFFELSDEQKENLEKLLSGEELNSDPPMGMSQ